MIPVRIPWSQADRPSSSLSFICNSPETWVAVRFRPCLHSLRRLLKHRSLPPTIRSLPLALERTNHVCDRQAFHSALFTNDVIRVRSILSAELIKHPVLGSTVPTFHSIRLLAGGYPLPNHPLNLFKSHPICSGCHRPE